MLLCRTEHRLLKEIMHCARSFRLVCNLLADDKLICRLRADFQNLLMCRLLANEKKDSEYSV